MKSVFSIIICTYLLLPNSIFAQRVLGNSSVTWEIDTIKKTLYIEGQGPMPNFERDDYSYYERGYWPEYSDAVENVIIKNGVTSIGDRTFMFCTKLKSIKIHAPITRIGNEAFYGCNLSAINLPSSLNEIGKSVFLECKRLKKIKIPHSVSQIGKGAFDRSGLQKIIIPSSIKTISKFCFSMCCIKKIKIPASVEKIEEYAFFGCYYLEEICIPSSVKEIGDSAFGSFGSCGLKKITLNWKDLSKVKLGEDIFGVANTSEVILIVPKNMKKEYEDTFNQKLGYKFKIIER